MRRAQAGSDRARPLVRAATRNRPRDGVAGRKSGQFDAEASSRGREFCATSAAKLELRMKWQVDWMDSADFDAGIWVARGRELERRSPPVTSVFGPDLGLRLEGAKVTSTSSSIRASLQHFRPMRAVNLPVKIAPSGPRDSPAGHQYASAGFLWPKKSWPRAESRTGRLFSLELCALLRAADRKAKVGVRVRELLQCPTQTSAPAELARD